MNLIVCIFHNKELISFTSSNENVLFENLIALKNCGCFPNYSLGINTPGSTSINDIVKERSTNKYWNNAGIA